MAPRLIFLIPSGSKKKEHRYACLSEVKASHSHRMWTEVSSCDVIVFRKMTTCFGVRDHHYKNLKILKILYYLRIFIMMA